MSPFPSSAFPGGLRAPPIPAPAPICSAIALIWGSFINAPKSGIPPPPIICCSIGFCIKFSSPPFAIIDCALREPSARRRREREGERNAHLHDGGVLHHPCEVGHSSCSSHSGESTESTSSSTARTGHGCSHVVLILVVVGIARGGGNASACGGEGGLHRCVLSPQKGSATAGGEKGNKREGERATHVGIQLESSLVRVDGFLVLARAEESVTEAGVGLGEGGIDGEGLLGVRDGRGVLLKLRVGGGAGGREASARAQKSSGVRSGKGQQEQLKLQVIGEAATDSTTSARSRARASTLAESRARILSTLSPLIAELRPIREGGPTVKAYSQHHLLGPQVVKDCVERDLPFRRLSFDESDRSSGALRLYQSRGAARPARRTTDTQPCSRRPA